MDEEETTEDPTIRDSMENGVVRARPRYTRAAGLRRTYKINYKALSAADRQNIRDFRDLVGGWMEFVFVDNRIAGASESLTVRFSKLPTLKDGGFLGGQKTFTASFSIEEV
jgi:hypothetical protein